MKPPRVDVGRVVVVAVLVTWAVVSLFPLVWMVGTSIKPVAEGIGGFHSMIPKSPTLDNFVKVAGLLPLARNTFNSIVVSVAGTVLTVFFCSLAGFAFAKYRFPGRDGLFLFLLATMLVPAEVGIVPTFLIMRQLGWINTYWALIVPRAATAIGIFYMRQYIAGFPNEVMEQGRIDGCAEFRIYWQLVLPVVSPALAAWSTIAFIARWNDFMWPLLLMRSKEMYTLMVSIAVLPVSEGLSTPWPVIMAGTAIAVFPLLCVYLILQRFQVAGLTLGAVKG